METTIQHIKPEIIFLQETHILENENLIKIKKYNKIYQSGTSKRSAGTAILIHDKIQLSYINTIQDTNGHYTIVTAKTQNKTILLCNIYAPNIPSLRKTFFKKIHQILKKYNKTDIIIIAGDFNYVEEQKDKTGIKYNENYHFTGKNEFNETKTLLNIKDIGQKEQYTFIDKRKNNNIKARLDRIYTNMEKIKPTNTTYTHISDHKILTAKIKLLEKMQTTSPYWKLNNNILNEKNYQNLIENLWTNWQNKKTNYDLNTWWDIGKTRIKNETIKYCVKRKKEIKKTRQKLLRKLNKLNKDKNKNKEKISDIRQKIQDINDEETFGESIRAKQDLAMIIEEPNAFFYRTEQQKQKKKLITELNINNQITKDEKKITQHIIEHFNNRFSQSKIHHNTAKEFLKETTKKITKEQNEMLEEKITIKELEKALENTKPNKSPGLDGLTYEFYKNLSPKIQKDLIHVMNNTIEKQNLTYLQKIGIITLIPKNGKDLNEIQNWRPITLLNTDYKLLTKIIATRLGQILPDIIDKNQVCSIKGRKIYHHTFLLRDLIQLHNNTKTPLYILNIDQEKAFDRVNWDYLDMTLSEFGFSNKFRQTVKTFYNDIKSLISINGQLYGWIKLKQGVRQGCPLSLLLYILIIETLHNNLKSTRYVGIHIPYTNQRINDIMYADDFTALTYDIKNFNILFETLTKFEKASNTKININKTTGIYLNHNKKEEPKTKIQVKWNDNKTKILGIYFTNNTTKNQILNWESITKKIENKYTKHKMKTLSYRARAIIVNTTILSKLWYIFRTYPPNNETKKKFTVLWQISSLTIHIKV